MQNLGPSTSSGSTTTTTVDTNEGETEETVNVVLKPNEDNGQVSFIIDDYICTNLALNCLQQREKGHLHRGDCGQREYEQEKVEMLLYL